MRDVGRVEVEIARVLPNQLQHLAPQMWDFSHPALYGNLEDKLVERFTTKRDYSARQPGKPTYDSIDVGQYLQDKAQARHGLFVLHIRSVDRDGADQDLADQDGDVERDAARPTRRSGTRA